MTFHAWRREATCAPQRSIVPRLCRPRPLRGLFVGVLPALAETMLGAGTWHVLLGLGQGAFLTACKLRRLARSAAPASHGIEWGVP